ncbi:MAG: class II aldolase/adducin family protein [Christensenella sp.]|nr:class II aldolase/adducin family protein [Christensenella sp.]
MPEFPSLDEAKEVILEIGRRMYQKGFVAANDGNISCKLGPKTILATPTGVSKGFMTSEMLVVMSLDGEVLEKNEKYRPSSEVKMHIRAYQENPNIMAVTHAHPPVATAFAIAGIPLDRPILTEALMSLGSVPVAKYATPGTAEVPASIAPFCREYNAVLLANHGALTWGGSLMQAFYRLESVEYYATLMMYTEKVLGKANCLSEAQVAPLMDIRANLGVMGGGKPAYVRQETNDRDVIPVSGALQEEKASEKKK